MAAIRPGGPTPSRVALDGAHGPRLGLPRSVTRPTKVSSCGPERYLGWTLPTPAPDVRDPSARGGWSHDHSREPHQALRRLHRRGRHLLRGASRQRRRIPGAQRCRQVHGDADDDRPHAAHLRPRHAARPDLPRAAQPGPPGRRDARRLGAAPGSYGPRGAARRRRVDRGVEGTGRRGARPRGPHRGGGRAPGAQLLARHAPAARHRRGPARRAAGPDPGRAGQRPRPAGHPLDARAAPALRRRRRHRAAVEPPAPRGADRGGRPGDDRPRPHRGDGLEGGAPQPRGHDGALHRRPTPRCTARARRRPRHESARGSGLVVDAEPGVVGRIAADERVVLLELRSGGSEGLEEMFLGLTAATSREGDAA